MSDTPLGTPASRLDRAIDRAVRDMMHADPRPGFRRRVAARLEREPIRSSMFSRIAIPAAALAVLVLAVVAMRWNAQTPTSATQQQARSTRVPDTHLPSARVEAANPQPPPSVRTPNRAPDRRRLSSEPITMPRVTNVFATDKNAVAATSVDADTLWPAPAPETHDDRQIGLAPLVIPALQPPPPIVIPPINLRGPGGGRP